jgi:hypothetical protein
VLKQARSNDNDTNSVSPSSSTPSSSSSTYFERVNTLLNDLRVLIRSSSPSTADHDDDAKVDQTDTTPVAGPVGNNNLNNNIDTKRNSGVSGHNDDKPITLNDEQMTLLSNQIKAICYDVTDATTGISQSLANDRRILFREQRGIGTMISCLRLLPDLISVTLPLIYQICDNHHNKEVFVRRKGLEQLAIILSKPNLTIVSSTPPITIVICVIMYQSIC